MGRTSRKLNFLIEEGVCRDLEMLVPAGKRSKIVNEALRKELDSITGGPINEKICSGCLRDSQVGSR
jgi:hypothetical protein